MIKKSLFADLVLLFVTFSWGATFLLVKEATEIMNTFAFLGVRFAIAAILLFIFMALWKRDQLKFNKNLVKAGLVLGFWLFSGYIFQTFGLQFTTASKAGFITGLSVVLVPLFSVFLLQMKPKGSTIIGIGLAVVGLALLSLDKVEAANIGDFLVFLCALSFAMHIIMTGKYAPQHKALPLATCQITAAAIFNLIGTFLFEPWQQNFSQAVIFHPIVDTSLIICAVFATALAFVAQSQFQKFTTPTRTALIFSTEPVFAAATAYFGADERLTGQAMIGCLLILAGMLFAELVGSSHKESSVKTTAS